jgi:hypothetical protein
MATGIRVVHAERYKALPEQVPKNIPNQLGIGTVQSGLLIAISRLGLSFPILPVTVI